MMGYSTAWVGGVESKRTGIQIEDISKWVELCGMRLEVRLLSPEKPVRAEDVLARLSRLWPILDARDQRIVRGLIEEFARESGLDPEAEQKTA